MRKTITGVGIAVAATVLLLAGCGNSEQPSTTDRSNTATGGPARQASHNEADIAFAQQMVPHHQQAVEMAKLAASRASSAQVKDLAGQIQNAQDPEIQQLNAWLAQWNATTPSTGMDHGSMMSDDEMRQLGQASGAAFDRMFLEMMTRHHQGAIETAKTEVATGADAEAKALAQRIIDAQQAEITEMRGMLPST